MWLVLTATLPGDRPPAGQQIPTFRTAVDVVQLDVTVLDKQHRPVRGLTARDFTVLDRGTPQTIKAFSEVDVPGPVVGSAPWMRDAPRDVVSNTDNRRLVTIVMDDAYTDVAPSSMRRAKQIARKAVEELGPADLGAVVFTLLGRGQNFTADRSLLTAAIDSYVPKASTGNGGFPLPCAPQMHNCDALRLATVVSALSSAPPGRKIVLLISGGRSFSFGEAGTMDNELSELGALFRKLQQANITVYAFDAHGLRVIGFSTTNQLPAPTPLGFNNSLYSFAESTGGRVFANTNDPASRVPEMFRENSVYYLLGFRASDTSDRGFRKVTVQVKKPNVEVRTRSGYYPPGEPTEAASDAIDGISTGDLPLHVTVAPFARTANRRGEAIIAARVAPSSDGFVPTSIDLSVAAYDQEGDPQGTDWQRLEGERRDLLSHLPLQHGRYMLRVTVTSEGHRGVVYTDVEVPDFAKDPVSVSGLLLHRGAGSIANREIANLIPFAPATAREFASTDDVSAFLRVYQGGKGAVAPVRVTSRIINDRNTLADHRETVLDVGRFSDSRAADYPLTLPLAHLSPGEYLLEVEAEAGAHRVKRTARFSVRN
jgi:VWFA-related protein